MRKFKTFASSCLFFVGFLNGFQLRAELRPCHKIKNKFVIKSTSIGKIEFPIFGGTDAPIDERLLDQKFGQRVHEICFDRQTENGLRFASVVEFYQDSLVVGQQKFLADLILNEHGNLIFFFFKEIDRQYLILRLEIDGKQIERSRLSAYDVRQLRLMPFNRIYANLYVAREKPSP